jgi:hypothetical protein
MTIRLMKITAMILACLGSTAFALIGYIVISVSCETLINQGNWIDCFAALDSWFPVMIFLVIAGIGGETTALIVARVNPKSKTMILASSLIGSACGAYFDLVSHESILSSESWFWWTSSIGSIGTYAAGTSFCILLSKRILAS